MMHWGINLCNYVFKATDIRLIIIIININLCNILGVLKSVWSKVYQVFEVDWLISKFALRIYYITISKLNVVIM